jgi:hypothetical protein
MQHHAAVVPVTIVVCNQNRVRVKKSLDDLKFGKGPLQAGMVGLVTSVSHDGRVEVDYGFQPKNELHFLLSELEPVYTGEGHWPYCPIQVGQPVRVKESISEPSCRWGSVKKGFPPLLPSAPASHMHNA